MPSYRTSTTPPDNPSPPPRFPPRYSPSIHPIYFAIPVLRSTNKGHRFTVPLTSASSQSSRRVASSLNGWRYGHRTTPRRVKVMGAKCEAEAEAGRGINTLGRLGCRSREVKPVATPRRDRPVRSLSDCRPSIEMEWGRARHEV